MTTAAKKQTIRWSVYGGILLSCCGFFITKTYDHVAGKFNKIDDLDKTVAEVVSKSESDKRQWEKIGELMLKVQALESSNEAEAAQWQLIREHDRKLLTTEVETRVLSKRVDGINRNQVITVQLVKDTPKVVDFHKGLDIPTKILQPLETENSKDKTLEQLEEVQKELQKNESIKDFQQKQIQRFKR